jgi:hypothetical protein
VIAPGPHAHGDFAPHFAGIQRDAVTVEETHRERSSWRVAAVARPAVAVMAT